VSRAPTTHDSGSAATRVGNNLNQLVKLAHSGAPLSLELYGVVQQVLAEVRRVRRALQGEPRG
jgi:hypothetical protein